METRLAVIGDVYEAGEANGSWRIAGREGVFFVWVLIRGRPDRPSDGDRRGRDHRRAADRGESFHALHDVYISATARTERLAVLTPNVDHFERIDDVQAVDWNAF